MRGTEKLMAEHQTILRVLASAEKLLTDDQFEAEPSETFVKFVDFLETYGDKLHHCKEEEILFPAMELHGRLPEQGPTNMMRHEHEQGRALVQRMHAVLAEDEFQRAAFAEPAMGFVELLRSHIAKEDQILYPMSERMISIAVFEEIDAAYAKAETNFPADIHEIWESWAVELATRVGVQQDRYVVMPSCHG